MFFYGMILNTFILLSCCSESSFYSFYILLFLSYITYIIAFLNASVSSFFIFSIIYSILMNLKSSSSNILSSFISNFSFIFYISLLSLSIFVKISFTLQQCCNFSRPSSNIFMYYFIFFVLHFLKQIFKDVYYKYIRIFVTKLSLNIYSSGFYKSLSLLFKNKFY